MANLMLTGRNPVSYDDDPQTRAYWRGRLPHWDVLNRPIFVTLHIRGAIPPEAAERIREMAAEFRRQECGAELQRLRQIFSEMENWLDRPMSEATLTKPAVASMLRDAIEERNRRGYWRTWEWVIMPTHLHVLYVGGSVGMKRLLEDFKNWTGRQAMRCLGLSGGRFWQVEWFDHWSRSVWETEEIRAYIRNNPVRGRMINTSEAWPHGSWSEIAEKTLQ